MPAPIKISPSSHGVIYDEERGLCIPVETPSSAAITQPETALILDRSQISMSSMYAQAFGSTTSRRVGGGIWSQNPVEFSAWTMTPIACGGDPETTGPITGDPIASVQALGTEQTLNTQPIRGNVDGIGLASASGNVSAVAWSAFDSSALPNSGSFAFLRAGESGGSQHTVSPDVSSRHLGTSAAVMANGDTVVIYSRVTGDEEPSRLVAQRISRSGSLVGGEIEVLPGEIRESAPLGQVVSLDNGFLVVYREEVLDSSASPPAVRVRMGAKLYDASGTLKSSRDDIGSSGNSSFAVATGSGNQWGLAEISGPNQIRVRTFNGTDATGNEETVSGGNIPADADIALAMQAEGQMMVAWNTFEGSDQRIDGAYLGSESELLEGPFILRRSGLANTLGLASDHRGNYVFAWEEGGRINANIYNGTTAPMTPADFSNISTGNQNSNVLVTVSPEGILSLVYDKSSTASGDVLHNITRRDYRIIYQ